jgi:hypothetical protein
MKNGVVTQEPSKNMWDKFINSELEVLTIVTLVLNTNKQKNAVCLMSFNTILM